MQTNAIISFAAQYFFWLFDPIVVFGEESSDEGCEHLFPLRQTEWVAKTGQTEKRGINFSPLCRISHVTSTKLGHTWTKLEQIEQNCKNLVTLSILHDGVIWCLNSWCHLWPKFAFVTGGESCSLYRNTSPKPKLFFWAVHTTAVVWIFTREVW